MKRVRLFAAMILLMAATPAAAAAAEVGGEEHKCYAVTYALGSKPVQLPCSPPAEAPAGEETTPACEPGHEHSGGDRHDRGRGHHRQRRTR